MMQTCVRIEKRAMVLLYLWRKCRWKYKWSS